MNITSNGSPKPPATCSAFLTSTRALSEASHERFFCSCAKVLVISAAAGRELSTATSSRAPRLSASMPNAPVPANRSSTRASSSTPHESRCEKIASLVPISGRPGTRFRRSRRHTLESSRSTRHSFTVQVHLRIPIMNNNGVLKRTRLFTSSTSCTNGLASTEAHSRASRP